MSRPPEGASTIAAVQASPVFLDREATVDKACALIAEAGAAGAKLAVFPEAFIPGYPDWVWDTTERLCEAAREAGTSVVIGINEVNVEASGNSLYNTLLVIDEAGELVAKHRKLVPTAAERLVWAQGDGSTLGVYDLPIGRVGALICWENYMPLARYAMYAWGTQIYVAPTWDRGEPWLSTMRHIAKEGGVYVVGCCIAMRRSDIPERLGLEKYYTSGHTQERDPEWVNVGDSCIVSPAGKFVAGPCHMEEDILYAEVDLRGMKGPHWMLDVAGHYGRPDVFQLTVNVQPNPMVSEGNRGQGTGNSSSLLKESGP
jgi:nitrilase